MAVVNNKHTSFARTNGHNLWFNVIAQNLLNNPNRVDLEIDAKNKRIIVRKNNESGMFKITRTRDRQCKISTAFLIQKLLPLKDKMRFIVHGGGGTIWFNF